MNIHLHKMRTAFYLFTVLIGIAISLPVMAHSGGTDASGGHHCWTNCSAYGYSYGEYHYHNSGYNYSSSSYSSGYDYSSYAPPSKSYHDVAGCSIYATTFEEVNNFNNLYKQELYRDANCDELNFHVTHVTPHERLTTYLQSIQEWKDVRTSYIAGCSFFDRSGNGHAVMVNDTYLAYTGRDPKCDELENHATWGTSYERLRDYLIANEFYQIRGTVYVDNEPTANAKVNLYYEDGSYSSTTYTSSDGTFQFYLMPKGNSSYRFKVESGNKKKNFKKWLAAGTDNNFSLYLNGN